MVSIVARLRKDLQELTDLDDFNRRLAKVEKDLEKIEKQFHEVSKEVDRVSRKTASINKKGPAQKRKPLIQLIEEIVEANGGGPMKVTDIKKILVKEKKIKTRAKNFYAVITVSLNNSPKFKKTGPGEYRLLKKAAKKDAAAE